MLGGIIESCGLKVVLAFFTAIAIAFLILPILIRWSRSKGQLVAVPNHRSSHFDHIPNSGGLMLYLAVLIPAVLFTRFDFVDRSLWLLVAFAVLFVTGVIDDFRSVDVKSKFLGQFLPALIIVLSVGSDALNIIFLDIAEIPKVVKYIFWVLWIVTIINAFNLIDGIDGLAGALGLFGSLVFGISFLRVGSCYEAVLAFSLAGGLAGFLPFNISSRLKIFLGDSGSLLIGGIMGLFSILALQSRGGELYNSTSFMIIGYLFIPLADLFRVFVKRILQKKSPFTAGREHIHHIIIDHFGLSHIKATRLILALQAGITLIFWIYAQLVNGHFFLFIVIIWFIFSITLEWVEKRVKKVIA